MYTIQIEYNSCSSTYTSIQIGVMPIVLHMNRGHDGLIIEVIMKDLNEKQ